MANEKAYQINKEVFDGLLTNLQNRHDDNLNSSKFDAYLLCQFQTLAMLRGQMTVVNEDKDLCFTIEDMRSYRDYCDMHYSTCYNLSPQEWLKLGKPKV